MDFAPFDKRNYPTLSVRDGYAEWSKTYDAVMFDEIHVDLLSRIETVAWSEVSQALDLACGTGYIGAWLRSQGVARVDGVDFTPEMMAQAETKGIYHQLTKADIRDTGLPASAYDLVTEVLACEHLEDLTPLYAEAARVATRGARFVVVGYHPHFMLSGIPTHFDRENGEPIAIEIYIHLFSDHVRAARRAGWTLAEMDEAVIDKSWVAVRPGFAKYENWPLSFCMVWSN